MGNCLNIIYVNCIQDSYDINRYFDFYLDINLNTKIECQHEKVKVKTNKIINGKHVYKVKDKYFIYLPPHTSKIYITNKRPIFLETGFTIDNSKIDYDDTIECKIKNNKIVIGTTRHNEIIDIIYSDENNKDYLQQHLPDYNQLPPEQCIVLK